jgi:type II secretory pathway predicted ATPase ExeA
MYESHYALTTRPFVETTDPVALVALPSREFALRRLRYGLERGGGPALAFGPAGAGKTILARALARELGGPCVHLTFPAMTAAELMAFLADELSAPPATGPGLAGSVRRVRAAAAQAVSRGRRPLVIVDEAHLVADPATFESLRLILNFTTAGAPDLALLLIGAPEVVLQLPPSLTDRLAAHCLIGGLSADESAAYVLARLAAAGAKEPLFAPDALAALHRAADGLPRRLNRLADLALLIAYAQDRPRPDADTVAIALREASFDALAA